MWTYAFLSSNYLGWHKLDVVFQFLRNCQSVFQNGVVFLLLERVCEFPLLHILAILGTVGLSHGSHSKG